MTTSKKIAQKIKVTIDDVNIFDAWSLEEVWNEWAIPYFEKREDYSGPGCLDRFLYSF